MNYLLSTKRDARSDLVKKVMCQNDIPDDARSTLTTYYKVDKYGGYVGRATLLPIFYLLYRKKVFETKSTFFLREILLITAGIAYITAWDIAANELMWMNCKDIVDKYSPIKQRFVADKTYLDGVKKSSRESAASDRLYEDE